MELRRLLLFMELMSKKIENTGANVKWFYTPADEKLLIKMDEESIKNTWNKLVSNIKEENSTGFSEKLFPFCIAYDMNCKYCTYPKNHGTCEEQSSDLTRLTTQLTDLRFPSHSIFNNEFYLDLLEDILSTPNRTLIYTR